LGGFFKQAAGFREKGWVEKVKKSVEGNKNVGNSGLFGLSFFLLETSSTDLEERERVERGDFSSVRGFEEKKAR
jgi:hypothetical protein